MSDMSSILDQAEKALLRSGGEITTVKLRSTRYQQSATN